jgi:hypothetical protein
MANMSGMQPNNLLRQLFMELSEEEVAIGGTWKVARADTTAMREAGGQTINKHNFEFTVAATEQKAGYDCWKIAFTGTTVTEGKGVVQGMDMTMDGTTKINGTAYFAPKEGLLISSESNSDIDMTQSFTGQQTFTQTFVVTVAMKTMLMK